MLAINFLTESSSADSTCSTRYLAPHAGQGKLEELAIAKNQRAFQKGFAV